MNEQIRILLAEDLETDVELAKRNLRKEFEDFEIQVVDNEPQFVDALENFCPDLIVSDYQMPNFDGMTALRITRKKNPLTPFVILTGAMNEDTAVNCMKAGADDYVIKEHIKRLGPAVKAAMEKKKLESQKLEAYKSLEENEERLRLAMESASEGMWEWNLKENQVYSDKVTLQMLGYKENELDKNRADIFKHIHPEDKEEILNKADEYIKGIRKKYDVEFRIRHKEGHYIWVSSLGKIVKRDDAGDPEIFIGVHRDITHLKKTQSELLAAKETAEYEAKKVSLLLEASKEVLESENFTLTARNLFDSCKKLTGATSGYVALLSEDGSEYDVLFLDSGGLPRKVDESLPMPVRGLRAETYNLSKPVMHNDFKNSDHVKFMPEGHVALSKVMFSPLVINKKSVGLIGLANKPTDFTNEDLDIVASFSELTSIALNNSRHMDEILKKNEELLEAKDSAEKSDELKTEFLHNMSHEIRTPMNGIIGFTEFLGEPNTTDEQRKYYIKIIKNSSRQLLKIIDDILEISTLETKQVRAELERFNLNELLMELFAVFNIRAKELNIALYLNKDLPDEESYLISDRSKLSKILSNLIDNALKFTHEGFIEFGYKQRNSIVELYVQDTGVGIDPENQELIFLRFSQENKELALKAGGLGLGLSIAKENTELLGGEISLKSAKGEGATFFVKLPLIEDKEESKQVRKSVQMSGHPEDIILVAEDEEVNHLFIETVFTAKYKSKYKLLHAKNGEEAVNLFKKFPNIKLVLMDLKMPVMSGFEATDIIKEMAPDLPIIAQTAYSNTLDRDNLLANKFDGYIEKPMNKDKFFTIFENLINRVNK